MKILAINPGGTSTKVAVYDGEKLLFEKTVRHSMKELAEYKQVFDQYEFRLNLVLDSIKEEGLTPEDLSCVVGRGGVLKPIPGGVYAVNDKMIEDMKDAVNGEHACNLGCVIAKEIADMNDLPSFVVDPVSVDEFQEVSRITGLEEISKKSLIHALNHKAVAKTVCKDKGWKYDEANLIVAHLGSGISIVPHKDGKMIDCTGGRLDGPFSNCRCGGLPTVEVINLCYSGKYSRSEIVKTITDKGGMFSYLGTADVIEIENAYDTDEKCKLILDAFVYQIVKDMAAYVPVLDNNVDGLILTGGIANSKLITGMISEKLKYIAPVIVVPGEEELEALAGGAMRAMNQEENIKEYL